MKPTAHGGGARRNTRIGGRASVCAVESLLALKSRRESRTIFCNTARASAQNRHEPLPLMNHFSAFRPAIRLARASSRTIRSLILYLCGAAA